MIVRVLGSAAGGGFPQWNCGCPNCSGLRSRSLRALPRTQECLAVSADGRTWFLINASPDIQRQIEAFPELHPTSLRGTPIAGIVVTNGDLDHCLGLLCLREWQRFRVYATRRVEEGFRRNVFARTLERFDGQVTWQGLELERETPLLLPDGSESGLRIMALPVPGKPPLHLSDLTPSEEDNIALRVTACAPVKNLAYVSGVGRDSESVRRAVFGTDVVFFDGTFWSDDELIALGTGDKKARDMAHWPIGGPGGSLELLKRLEANRRVLIHINNTNPVLREDSPERAAVRAAGVEVAYDGLEISP